MDYARSYQDSKTNKKYRKGRDVSKNGVDDADNIFRHVRMASGAIQLYLPVGISGKGALPQCLRR